MTTAPGITVRSVNPPGEADIVALGPNHELRYFHALPGQRWGGEIIPGSSGSTAAPTIAVRSVNPPGEADVVTLGPNHELKYFFAMPGQPWAYTLVEIAGTLAPAQANIFLTDQQSIDLYNQCNDQGFNPIGWVELISSFIDGDPSDILKPILDGLNDNGGGSCEIFLTQSQIEFKNKQEQEQQRETQTGPHYPGGGINGH